MIYTNNTSIINAKQFLMSCRHLVNNSISILAVIGFIYLVYWFGCLTDPQIVERGENMFKPLASFIFSNIDSIDIYKNTGLLAFALTIPVGFMYYIINKIEAFIIIANNKQNELIAEKQKQKEFYNHIKEFEEISNYCLCLSVDYKSEKKFSQKNKDIINNGIYSKIENVLDSVAKNISITKSEVLIINSNDFNNYDKVYDAILTTLSEIKPKIENRYNIKIIPSITTDAYNTETTINKIKEKHFGIQNCISNNRACTTEKFAKKYKYLNKRKYAGVPIGEYISSNKETYELNIIHKNLSQTLASIS